MPLFKVFLINTYTYIKLNKINKYKTQKCIHCTLKGVKQRLSTLHQKISKNKCKLFVNKKKEASCKLAKFEGVYNPLYNIDRKKNY